MKCHKCNHKFYIECPKCKQQQTHIEDSLEQLRQRIWGALMQGELRELDTRLEKIFEDFKKGQL